MCGKLVMVVAVLACAAICDGAAVAHDRHRRHKRAHGGDESDEPKRPSLQVKRQPMPTLLTAKADVELTQKVAPKRSRLTSHRKRNANDEAATTAAPPLPPTDTHATASVGACDSHMTLTACEQIDTGTVVSCMTVRQPDGQCVVEFVRQKDDAAHVFNQKFYHVVDAPKTPSSLAVSAVSDDLVVRALPSGVQHLDFMDIKRLTFEHLVIPDGVHVLRLAHDHLTGYPTKGFQNITLPSSMTRLALRKNQLTSFDPSGWVNSSLVDIFVQNNLLSDLGNVTYPPTVTTLNLRNNVISKFGGTVLPPLVRVLNLGGNHIASISSIPLTNLVALDRLDLAGNKELVALTLQDVLPPQLSELNLRGCSVASINPGFHFPANLSSLDLSQNRLTSIWNLTLPPALERLKLDGNPIQNLTIQRKNLAVLQQLQVLTAPTTSSTMRCQPHEDAVTVQNVVLCVASIAPATPSSFVITVLPVLLGGFGAAFVFAMGFALYIRRRAHRHHLHVASQETNAAQNNLPFPPHDGASDTYEEGQSSVDDMSAYSSTLIAPATTVMLEACPEALDTHAMQRWAIPIDKLHDIAPAPHSGLRARFNDQFVALTPLMDAANTDETLALLTSVHHPALVQFHGVTWSKDDEMTLVTEYVGGATLAATVGKRRDLSWAHKVAIALDIAQALATLHDVPVVHGNVSTHSVVLADRRADPGGPTAKLRLPCGVCDGIGLWSNVVTTKMWMSPEMRETQTKTKQGDVYALGIVLAVLETGTNDDRCVARAKRLGTIVQRCVASAPQERPEVAWVVLRLQDMQLAQRGDRSSDL